jgi:ADP-ribose pyrophosphatase
MIKKWRVLKSDVVLENRWAKVRRDTCLLPNGLRIDDYYYWEGGDFAQIFALTRDSRVVLVRQYKHGVKNIVLELPAGLVSADDKSPLVTARRELREETGFEAERWHSLGGLNVSSAKATTRAFPFIALDARRTTGMKLDQTEEIEVSLYPLRRLINAMAKGKIRDANSIATSLLALSHLRRI